MNLIFIFGLVMIQNTLLGTSLHAIGGISASCCYLPFQKVRMWTWDSYWLVQAVFAWLIFPILIGYITVPNLIQVLQESPWRAIQISFYLGAIYGFGGMAFGYAIKYFGFSLTYTISIGISAVLGTLVPMIMEGTFMKSITTTGGIIVFFGMAVSILGVIFCGRAGHFKELDLNIKETNDSFGFEYKKGLMLAVFAGILSAIFGVSLSTGEPISQVATKYGAGHFEGNAKLIISTSGCFATNFIWFIIAGVRNKTIGELVAINKVGLGSWLKNLSLCVITGGLWYFQFFFYGLGHVSMGEYKFASWGIHMSMLVFFSYLVGIAMKEWVNVSKKTYHLLLLGLLLLIVSFVIITYGSMFSS